MLKFNNPKLIEGAKYSRSGSVYAFSMGASKFKLRLDEERVAEVVEEILQRMWQGTDSTASLAKEYDSRLAPHNVEQLIHLLAERSVLVESSSTDAGIPGANLHHQVRAFYRSFLEPKLVSGLIGKKFKEGRLTHRELKAWTIEYYFVTKFAEQCVVASLCHIGNPALRAAFEELFFDEVGHDRLLERSLSGFGCSGDEIGKLAPHISTVATMGMLLRYSIFDIPAFITIISQMEGSEARSNNYIDILRQSGLPAEAIEPQIKHEQINIENDHFGEALKLAEALGSVHQQDIERCKRTLHLYLATRELVYPHVFSSDNHANRLDASVLISAWAQYSENIKKALLPIAASNADEVQSRRFVRMLVAIKKAEVMEWDANSNIQLAAAVLENALWKLAYQSSSSLADALDWLDKKCIHGFVPHSSNLPLFLSREFLSV